MYVLLVVLLCLLIVGVFPAWPHSRKWGPAPSGMLLIVLVVVLLVLLTTGRF
jgi:hypothetical protein